MKKVLIEVEVPDNWPDDRIVGADPAVLAVKHLGHYPSRLIDPPAQGEAVHKFIPQSQSQIAPDALGYCCYGGNRTKADCGDCVKWSPVGGTTTNPGEGGSVVRVPMELLQNALDLAVMVTRHRDLLDVTAAEKFRAEVSALLSDGAGG